MAPPGSLALVLIVLSACGDGPTTASPGDATSSSEAGGSATEQPGEVEISWLDDDQLARSQAIHRMGGTVTAPRDAEPDLRRITRDALVERARALGFRRLDDLQIEVDCDPDAPAATACTAKVVAVASR